MITIEDIKNRLDIESESYNVITTTTFNYDEDADDKRQEIIDYLEENGIDSDENYDDNSLILSFRLDDQYYDVNFEYEYNLTINGIDLYIDSANPDEYDFSESVVKIYDNSYSYDEFISNYNDFIKKLNSDEIHSFTTYERIADLVKAVDGVKNHLQKENTLDDNSIEEIVEEIFSKFIV